MKKDLMLKELVIKPEDLNSFSTTSPTTDSMKK